MLTALFLAFSLFQAAQATDPAPTQAPTAAPAPVVAQQTAENTTAAPATRVVCRRETEMGSNRSRRVCRNVEDVEHRRETDRANIKEHNPERPDIIEGGD